MKAKSSITGNLLIFIFLWFVGSHQTLQAQLSLLYSEEEIKQQIEDAKKGAEAGDLESQYVLASMYRMKDYGMLDLEKSREWMKKAADNGYARSQSEMSSLYLEEENYKAAFKYAKLAADQGEDSYLVNLAGFYRDGLGVPKDLQKAADLYKRAGAAYALINMDLEKYSINHPGWTFFAESQEGSRFYYQPQSVLKIGSDLKVLIKEVRTHSYASEVQGGPAGYTIETYDKQIKAYLVDCSDNTLRIEEVHTYNGSEKIKVSDRYYDEHKIKSGTIINALKMEICY